MEPDEPCATHPRRSYHWCVSGTHCATVERYRYSGCGVRKCTEGYRTCGVGFIIGVIQDSVETALNSSGDVFFTATAEYYDKRKGKSDVRG